VNCVNCGMDLAAINRVYGRCDNCTPAMITLKPNERVINVDNVRIALARVIHSEKAWDHVHQEHVEALEKELGI